MDRGTTGYDKLSRLRLACSFPAGSLTVRGPAAALPGATGVRVRSSGPAGPAQDPANRQLARIAGATRQDPARSRAAAHVGALTGAARPKGRPIRIRDPDTPDGAMGSWGLRILGNGGSRRNARRWSDRRVRGRSGFRDVPMSEVSVRCRCERYVRHRPTVRRIGTRGPRRMRVCAVRQTRLACFPR